MRVFVYGSCVSRDLMPYLARHGYELVDYCARQSLLSAMSGAVPVEVPAERFASKFQLRSMRSDFAGDLLDRVQASRDGFDLLLWDLTDERSGVLRFGDAYATDNWELHATGAIDDLAPDARLPLDDDEHFAAWRSAADRFLGRLRELGVADRVVLLAPDFAERDTAGEPFEARVAAGDLRRSFARYLDHLVEGHGIPCVTATADEVATSLSHQWGPAPFHYDRPTCRMLARRLARAAAPLVASDAEIALSRRARREALDAPLPAGVAADLSIGGPALPVRLRVVREDAATACTIFVTGAVDPRIALGAPVYQREDWAPEVPGTVAFLADPTLALYPELRVGWGAGSRSTWAVPVLAGAVDGLVERLEREAGEAVEARLVGTSAGAFLALAVASLCRTRVRAVVANPVLSWRGFPVRSTVDEAARAVAGSPDAGPDDLPPQRVDTAELWRLTASLPAVTLALNTAGRDEAMSVLAEWTERLAPHAGNPSLGDQRVRWYGEEGAAGRPPGRAVLTVFLRDEPGALID